MCYRNICNSEGWREPSPNPSAVEDKAGRRLDYYTLCFLLFFIFNLIICVPVYCIWVQCPWRPAESVGSLWSEKRLHTAQYVCWELNSSPLQDECVPWPWAVHLNPCSVMFSCPSEGFGARPAFSLVSALARSITLGMSSSSVCWL